MNETIAAIATAHGVGSIAIVRVSGERAYAVALAISKKSALTPRHATLSQLYDAQNEPIDEALLLYFKAPHSFTAEDVVEFQCHGGQMVAELVLERIVAFEGVRLAEAGEFSKRAYLNGRIDLSEAEAIAQLIEAKSEDAVKILNRQMHGELREFVQRARESILEVLAYAEVSIDYAEEDLPQDMIERMSGKLLALRTELERTLQTSLSRRGLMQGFRVSIVGKPNVGKSSLLNTLLRYDRAIVSEIAGTTRDTIEEQIRIGSHLIKIVDTAGIRSAGDEIERIGIERSVESIRQSDIVLALFDNSRRFDEEDGAIVELLLEYKDVKDIVVVINKCDLASRLEREALEPFEPLEISAKDSADMLIERLQKIMDANNFSDEVMLVSNRQIEAVRLTCNEIENAMEPLQEQLLEIFTFHLYEALKALESITSRFENDELLDKMFGNFCLGK